jgi:hypothetical protein
MIESGVQTPAPMVDWSTITTSVQCPLCLYNLRGLSEPRCPECGYQFQWPDLLEPGRARHRYLFEHHPERNLWSFFRTLIAGIRPRRFWTELKPTQFVRRRRLIIYWIVCSCLMLLLPLSRSLWIGIDLARTNAQARSRMPVGVTSLYSAQGRQTYLDRNYPLPPSRGFFQQYHQVLHFYLPGFAIELGTITIWPWLTFAALMIFQASMRKAKVQRAHVCCGA